MPANLPELLVDTPPAMSSIEAALELCELMSERLTTKRILRNSPYSAVIIATCWALLGFTPCTDFGAVAIVALGLFAPNLGSK